MTDKEIIIDGVDVSECVEFRDDVYTDKQINNACSIGLWQRHYSGLEENCKMSCECKNNSDCYFKQLKRKEQECEELKREIAFWSNEKCSDSKKQERRLKRMQNKKTKLFYILKWLSIFILLSIVTSMLCTFVFGIYAFSICVLVGMLLGHLCIWGYMEDKERFEQ